MYSSQRMRWVAILGLVVAAVGHAAPQAVDLLFVNGKVVTVDERFTIHSAVAVKDGLIVAVGGKALANDFTASRTIDLKGRTLMPGFIDTHLHLQARSPRSIDAEAARSIADLQRMIREKAAQLGAGQWVTGYGWDEALLSDKRNPTRADLDAAAPNNPVELVRAGSHSVVANSAALRLAGITKDTPDPLSGIIEHGADGEPNGIIRERTDLLINLVPPDSPAEMRPSYIASLKALLALGITSFIEATSSLDDEPVQAGGRPEVAAADDMNPFPSGLTFKQFQSIYAELGSELPRVALYISYPGAERLKAFPHKTGYGDARLRLGPIGENPYDGGFTGPTALTKADYKGQPGFRGKTLISDAAAQEMIDTSARLGWQLGTHAIGDAAIERVVAMYDQALRKYPRKDHRWFTSHFTMLPSNATLDLMAKDGIYATAQPNFLYNLEGRYVATLDGYRLEHINPVATPLKHHVFIGFSSDNLPIGPMVGLYTAITRKGASGRVFGIEEAVSRETAIRLYTRDAAYFTWEEKQKGTLEPGKFADLIVLDRDPLTVPEAELLTTQVDLTVVGGAIVYERTGHQH